MGTYRWKGVGGWSHLRRIVKIASKRKSGQSAHEGQLARTCKGSSQ